MSEELDVKHINGKRAMAKGSKPPPIVHQYLGEDGDPYDMSVGVWAGQGRAEQLHTDTQPPNIGSGGTTVNTTTAEITYNWHTADFATVGRFRIILWAGDGTQRIGSTVYEWDVADGPGADPTV